MSKAKRSKEADKKAAGADFPFEETLAEVEELVEKMEGGQLTLEESLASFERGVKLTRECQAALRKAEQRVAVLMADADEDELPEELGLDGDEPLDDDDET